MIRLLLIASATLLPLSVLAGDEIKWGQPVNGLRIGIESPVTSTTSDQNPTFKVTAQNVSQQPITLPTPDTYLLESNRSDDFHHTPLSPVVTRTQMLQPTATYKGHIGSNIGPAVESLRSGVVTIAPSQSVTWNNVPLESQFYDRGLIEDRHQTYIDKSVFEPGYLYHIQFRFQNDQPQVENATVWTGQVDSGAVDLQVNAPSTDGIKLDAGFSLPKQNYFLGEPIETTFTVTNTGNASVNFLTGGDYAGSGRHDRYSFHAVDSWGWSVSDPLGWNWPFTNHVGGGLGGDVTVDPGKSYTEKLLINQWCAFSKPGTYQITCKRTLNVILSSQRDPNSHIRLDSTMPSIPVETTLEITLEDNPSAQAAYLAGLTPVLIRYDVSTQEAGKQIKDVSEQFRSLAQAQTAAAFPEIVKLLDGPPAVQVDAVQWLSYYPSSEAGPVLLAHAPKLLPEARLSALQSLSNWNTPGVEPLLATTLSDQDHELRANAVLICSKKWYASCVPILLTMGDDPDPIVRRYLGAALGASGDQQAIPVLLKLLHDPDSDLLIKTWAAVGLGKFKHMEGVPVLIDLLHDPDASRYGVIDILSQLTGQDFNDNSNTCLDWWAKTGRAQYGNQ